jgi:hypothetical protein
MGRLHVSRVLRANPQILLVVATTAAVNVMQAITLMRDHQNAPSVKEAPTRLQILPTALHVMQANGLTMVPATALHVVLAGTHQRLAPQVILRTRHVLNVKKAATLQTVQTTVHAVAQAHIMMKTQILV